MSHWLAHLWSQAPPGQAPPVLSLAFQACPVHPPYPPSSPSLLPFPCPHSSPIFQLKWTASCSFHIYSLCCFVSLLTSFPLPLSSQHIQFFTILQAQSNCHLLKDPALTSGPKPLGMVFLH